MIVSGKLKTANKTKLEALELFTITFLLEQGFDIEVIEKRTNKTLDVIMNGEIWEIKTPIGIGKRNIENTLKRASHQSSKIIIDIRKNKREKKQLLKEIKKEMIKRNKIKKILLITKDEKLSDIKNL